MKSEDISAVEVLEKLNMPNATDSERGLRLTSLAGRMTGIYDAQGNYILVRAEQLRHYLDKEGFSIHAPSEADMKKLEKLTEKVTAAPSPTPPPPAGARDEGTEGGVLPSLTDVRSAKANAKAEAEKDDPSKVKAPPPAEGEPVETRHTRSEDVQATIPVTKLASAVDEDDKKTAEQKADDEKAQALKDAKETRNGRK